MRPHVCRVELSGEASLEVFGVVAELGSGDWRYAPCAAAAGRVAFRRAQRHVLGHLRAGAERCVSARII